MPATGVFAPERIFVAVLASAPVAGRPPKIGDATLATPCAMSSTFGLCLSPLIRSATTADISDSIAPSMATVMAGRTKSGIRWGSNRGMAGIGRPEGMPPKREPMVSTARPSATTASVPPPSAITVPGIFGKRRRSTTIVSKAVTDSTVAGADSVPACAAKATIRGQNSAGMAPISRPKKSLICVLAMSTAMPFVKPMTTGRGRYLTAFPMPLAPSTIRMTPAIIVHMKRPETPCSATMLATTTTNAPVGPPICVRDPPRAEIRNPVTIAQ